MCFFWASPKRKTGKFCQTPDTYWIGRSPFFSSRYLRGSSGILRTLLRAMLLFHRKSGPPLFSFLSDPAFPFPFLLFLPAWYPEQSRSFVWSMVVSKRFSKLFTALKILEFLTSTLRFGRAIAESFASKAIARRLPCSSLCRNAHRHEAGQLCPDIAFRQFYRASARWLFILTCYAPRSCCRRQCGIIASCETMWPRSASPIGLESFTSPEPLGINALPHRENTIVNTMF